MREDSFCIFIFYESSLKSRVLEEWAELVASQLTQFIYFLTIENKIGENQWLENSVYLD